MGVRKNYRNLTNVERDRFVQALRRAKETGVVDRFAEMHSRHFFMSIHRSSHFLPWHREMILRFERELQRFHPDITIPYWDSSVDRNPSDPNGWWNNGFLGQFNSAWNLRRALGSATLPTQQQVQTNQRRDSYASFWPELEDDIHNPPHRWVNGVMADIASPGDPVFYLHHCWIDMLWARWQLAHPEAPFVADGADTDLHDPLMEWPDRTPATVLEHHSLGYSYDIEQPTSPEDIVWHHSGTGETQIWRMDGHRIVGRATVVGESPSPVFVGPPFYIVGVGDLTGNGRADIVWHNEQTNETQIWRMDQHRVTVRTTVVGEDGQPAFVGPPFHIVGVGDVV